MCVVAAIQMATGCNVEANLQETERLMDEAVASGAQLLVLPENFALMAMREKDKFAHVEAPGQGPMQDRLRQYAKSRQVWIVGGTIPIRSNDPNRAYQTCFVYDANGEQVARYDKIHLFDVAIEHTGENYQESLTTASGDDVVVVETPFGRLGLSICYDVRFPSLYRAMLDEGMEIVVVPSAFTKHTGAAHWEPLLRARAIENLCYVVAPAQGGYHVNGRETYGHSMIVDPWGRIVAQREQGRGHVLAELELEKLRSTRRSFPTIEHRRMFCRVTPAPVKQELVS